MQQRAMVFVGVFILAVIAIAMAGFLYVSRGSLSQITYATSTGVTTTIETWACNADAKICPDGSSVGRTGPACEFMACPPADAKEATVTTYMGGTATALNVSVNVRELVSDSRCPTSVQCIWAGTVEARVALSTQVSHGEHVMRLGEARVFGDYMVTLTEVTPYPSTPDQIPESSYRFTFLIERR